MALVILTLWFAGALSAPLIYEASLVQDRGAILSPPQWGDAPLGRDPLGRDVALRIWAASPSALGTALVPPLAAFALALPLAAMASLWPRIHRWVPFFATLILSFPPVVLLLLSAQLFSPGWQASQVALVVLFVPVVIRQLLSDFSRGWKQPWVLSARGLGLSGPAMFRHHVLPHSVGSALALGSNLAAIGLGLEGTFSFIGLGSQPPQPSWSLMLKEHRSYMDTHLLLVVAPALCILLGIGSFLALSRAARGSIYQPRPGRHQSSGSGSWMS